MSRKIGYSENLKIKQEAKEDFREYDAALNARDRLKGALQDLQGLHSDNSSDSDDYKVKSSYKKNDRDKSLQKRKKHKIGAIKETPFQHTFVMKLFDRSVDLAQFEENTPLYPICRAWMANNPRSFVNSKTIKDTVKKVKKEEKRETSSKKFKLDDILLKEVYNLPPPHPLEADSSPAPPPVSAKKDFEISSDSEKNLPTREVLLASHLTHWAEVKKKMRTEAFKREERFEPSKKILKRIFHGAQ